MALLLQTHLDQVSRFMCTFLVVVWDTSLVAGGGIPRELPRERPRPVVIESSSHAGDSGYSLILSLDFYMQ